MLKRTQPPEGIGDTRVQESEDREREATRVCRHVRPASLVSRRTLLITRPARAVAFYAVSCKLASAHASTKRRYAPAIARGSALARAPTTSFPTYLRHPDTA